MAFGFKLKLGFGANAIKNAIVYVTNTRVDSAANTRVDSLGNTRVTKEAS